MITKKSLHARIVYAIIKENKKGLIKYQLNQTCRLRTNTVQSTYLMIL